MRTIISIGIVLCIYCSVLAYAAKPPSSTLETVLRLEHEWADVHAPQHVHFLETLLSDDFVDVSYKGRLRSKADVLAGAVTPAFESQTLSDLQVRQFANTVVVTGLNTVTGKQHAWVAKLRFTDVFVQRAGGWNAVSSQETLESSR